MNVIIYKLGHDENNLAHITNASIFKSKINNKNPESDCYEPENWVLSEFSTIRELLKLEDLSKYDYVGLCHYRTLIGNIDPNTKYLDALNESRDAILDELCTGRDGIISTNVHPGIPNIVARPRWTGTKSLEYLYSWLKRSDMGDKFIDYLNSDDSSYRVVNVLPRDVFKQLFEFVVSAIPFLIKCRINDGTLIPRSVGYELETLTSFLLVECTKHLDIARVKNSVINLNI